MKQVPRLVYIGDVPVENYVHGSLALYRLLSSYPTEKIQIIEIDAPSDPGRRLASVKYFHVPKPGIRLSHTRLARVVSPIQYFPEPVWYTRLVRLTAETKPEAVVTVPHGPGWLAAVEVARRLGVPWHLIIHDHHWNNRSVLTRRLFRLEQRFEEAYRGAASRFCVSPRMERFYRAAYGVGGLVLYPCGPVGRLWRKAWKELRSTKTWTFMGSIFNKSVVRVLATIADLLRREDDERLVIYGPRTHLLQESGLLRHLTVEYRGFIDSEQFLEIVSRDADVLVLPVSFDASENMHLSFPSKLVDYTGLGLPILAVAPVESPLGEWVQENAEAAFWVTEPTREALAEAVDRLRGDAELRLRLAKGALAAGERCFAHERVFGVFIRAVCGQSA